MKIDKLLSVTYLFCTAQEVRTFLNIYILKGCLKKEKNNMWPRQYGACKALNIIWPFTEKSFKPLIYGIISCVYSKYIKYH